MPNTLQHAQRVKSGLAFLSSATATSYPQEQVTAYFYTCLHMFEAVCFEVAPQYGLKKHFESHSERTTYFNRGILVGANPFLVIGQDYQALRELSESARYLSPAGTSNYVPLVIPRDVTQAGLLHGAIKAGIEEVLSKNKKLVPW